MPASGLRCAPLVLVGFLLMGASPSPTPVPAEVRGQTLFAQYCTGCHGEKGDGNGPAAHLLDPRPADLTRHGYTHGDENHDIYQVIAKGVPRTSMAAWTGALRPDQIQDIVFYLQQLRRTP